MENFVKVFNSINPVNTFAKFYSNDIIKYTKYFWLTKNMFDK